MKDKNGDGVGDTGEMKKDKMANKTLRENRDRECEEKREWGY